MGEREELKQRIYEIEEKIRQAPDDTPPRKIYEWYASTDGLRDRLEKLEKDSPAPAPDESNDYPLSNAGMEAEADETERQDFVRQWNEDSDQPQTWSQIVGTAKD